MKNFLFNFLKQNATPISLLGLVILNILVFTQIFKSDFLNGGDSISHFVYAQRIAEMISEGNFRFWLPDFSMGQPLFFYYQPLPHLVTAFCFLLFPMVESVVIMQIITVTLLSVLPLSVYQGLRWIGLSKLVAVLSAVLMCFLQSWKGFGFEFKTMLQWGLYAQLWGMLILPLGIGYIYKSYFGKRKLLIPVLIIGFTLLFHVVSGIVLGLATGLLLLIDKWAITEKKDGLFYLMKIFGGGFIIASIILIPTALYGDYISGYFKLDEGHRIGLGMVKASEKLFGGELFDYGRFPIITILTFSGIALVIYQIWTNKLSRFLPVSNKTLYFLLLNFFMSFLLVSGAKTFTFLQYTPLYNNLPFLRLISHWQFFAVPFAAISIAVFTQFSILFYQYQHAKFLYPRKFAVLSFFVLLGLVFIYLGSHHLATFNKSARLVKKEHFSAYFEAMNFLKVQAPGRVHQIGMPHSIASQHTPIYAGKPISKFYAAGSRSNLGQYYLDSYNDYESTHYQLFGYRYIIGRKHHDFNKLGKLVYENRGYKIYETFDQHQHFDLIQSNTLISDNTLPARALMRYWMHQPNLVEQKNHIALLGNTDPEFLEGKRFTNKISLTQWDKRWTALEVNLINEKTAEEITTVVDNKDEGMCHYLTQTIEEAHPSVNGKVLNEFTEDGYYKAEIEVNTTSNAIQWALLKVNAHADWVAKVDGKPTEWIQMSPGFMAVPLGNGKHTVEFEFGVSNLRLGLLGIGILTILGLWLWEYGRLLMPTTKLKSKKTNLEYA